MRWLGIGVSLIAPAAAGLWAASAGATGLHPVGKNLSDIVTIGDMIASTPGDKSVHIIFVHGINAPGPGTAQIFMKGMCQQVKNLACPPTTPDGDFDIEQAFFHSLTLTKDENLSLIFGEKIWPDDASWKQSQPFVLRYVFKGLVSKADGKKAPDVIVDEVNYWPLLFALKCRYLIATDAQLVGPNKELLDRCFQPMMVHGQDFGSRISRDEYNRAIRGPAKFGGGTLFNKSLKTGMLDFGISDAVIAIGPMKQYIHEAINKAFAFADSQDDQLAIVSESLGSFVVLDSAYNSVVSPEVPAGGKNKAREVLEKTNYLYFFANQFALLELARVSGPTAAVAEGVPPEPGVHDFAAPFPLPPTPVRTPVGTNQMLSAWSAAEGQPSYAHKGGANPAFVDQPPVQVPKQIVAFHDPDDLLTFMVPENIAPSPGNGAEGADQVNVFNILDENIVKWYDIRWFGLVKNPLDAHTGHSQNKSVLTFLFTPQAAQPKAAVSRPH